MSGVTKNTNLTVMTGYICRCGFKQGHTHLAPFKNPAAYRLLLNLTILLVYKLCVPSNIILHLYLNMRASSLENDTLLACSIQLAVDHYKHVLSITPRLPKCITTRYDSSDLNSTHQGYTILFHIVLFACWLSLFCTFNNI